MKIANKCLAAGIVSVVLLLLPGCDRKAANEVAPTAGAAPGQSGTEARTDMVQIAGGRFLMGDREQVDAPPHEVVVSPFHMDKYPVTQELYQKVTGSNPSRWRGDRNPVEQVRWAEAAEFCNKRSGLDGLQPCYDMKGGKCNFDSDGYRLPTEAEWEYACRAGTTTAWFFGDTPEKLRVYAWFDKNSGGRPRPVGQNQPNPWGLHDICGNVWEWCNDFYKVDYYQEAPRDDPRGPASGETMVVRGGAWRFSAESCRSGYRYNENPGSPDACFGYDVYGFRCVRKAAGSLRPQTGHPTKGPQAIVVSHGWTER